MASRITSLEFPYIPDSIFSFTIFLSFGVNEICKINYFYFKYTKFVNLCIELRGYQTPDLIIFLTLMRYFNGKQNYQKIKNLNYGLKNNRSTIYRMRSQQRLW